MQRLPYSLSKRNNRDPFALRASAASVSNGYGSGAFKVIFAPLWFETPYGPSPRTEPLKRVNQLIFLGGIIGEFALMYVYIK